jgi:CheY-like chemotaxis protein
MSGSASQSSRVILAVDDSASMRQMVRFTLESAGYRVVQAVDGVEALDLRERTARSTWC